MKLVRVDIFFELAQKNDIVLEKVEDQHHDLVVFEEVSGSQEEIDVVLQKIDQIFLPSQNQFLFFKLVAADMTSAHHHRGCYFLFCFYIFFKIINTIDWGFLFIVK